MTLRAKPEVDDIRPDFAFHGYRESVRSMDEFAQAVSRHPHFAKAWTAKACAWLNSAPCDEKHPEFERIRIAFADNGYKINTLLVDLLTSSIFTETNPLNKNSGLISITRRGHFCHALSTRIKKIRELNNFPALATQNTIDPCTASALAIRDKAALIPDDEYIRGQIDFLQASQPDAFWFKSVDRFCDLFSSRAVGVGVSSHFKPDSSEGIAQSLDDMTRFIMGIPRNSNRVPRSHAKCCRTYLTLRLNHLSVLRQKL